jgi:hypothetical protein
MSADILQIAGIGLGFVILFATGIRLRRRAKPYDRILLAVHKLTAVAMVVFIVWSTIATNRDHALSADTWALFAIDALAFAILLGTGGILSAAEASSGRVTRRAHKALAYGSILLTVLWFHLK